MFSRNPEQEKQASTSKLGLFASVVFGGAIGAVTYEVASSSSEKNNDSSVQKSHK